MKLYIKQTFSLLEAKIDEYSDWIKETDPSKLKETFEPLLKKAGFGVLNFMEHHFEPQGYTAIWLLAESHFAIHTFPEQSLTYIQLASCNTGMYFAFQKLVQDIKKSE